MRKTHAQYSICCHRQYTCKAHGTIDTLTVFESAWFNHAARSDNVKLGFLGQPPPPQNYKPC